MPNNRKNFQHQELADGKWFALSLDEQLGNIGSEVGRSINWKSKGNAEQMQKALTRGLELFDLTLADSRWRQPQLKEIARAREVFCDFLIGNNEYGSDEKFLNDYFMQFAIAARSNR
jgi:hypothetical protein